MAAKKKKTLHPTVARKKRQTYQGVDPSEMFFLRARPVHDDYIEALGEKLIHWALHDKNALKLSDFRQQEGIYQSTWEDWVKKYPTLKRAVAEAKIALGNRREIGALKRQYDGSMIRHTMHLYDPEWKAADTWRMKVKQEIDDEERNITIMIPPIPDDKSVPRLTDEEEE